MQKTIKAWNRSNSASFLRPPFTRLAAGRGEAGQLAAAPHLCSSWTLGHQRGSCSVLVTSEQLPVSSQLPAADCLLRSLGRAQLRPADGYNNTALYRVTATSHPPPLSVNLSYFQWSELCSESDSVWLLLPAIWRYNAILILVTVAWPLATTWPPPLPWVACSALYLQLNSSR